tara:strand:+ start:64 stop:1209 length:1146 start_codon:yes stop_codon:yes gene_type:complete
MRQNLFYWGPFIDDNIGTKKAIFNSALSVNKFSKKYKSTIINSIGEWDDDQKNNLVNFLDLHNKDYKKLPRFGFIRSRISFIIIFIKCFWKLKKVLNKEKPEYLIVHLMTSIPFVLFLLFRFKTKILFRVSGKPKLNFLRKILWKLVSKNISLVFCNTAEQRNEIIGEKIFSEEKIKVLYDPVFSISEVLKERSHKEHDNNFKRNNIIMVGRLTKQKNFEIFIKASEQLYRDNLLKCNTYIFGSGEDRDKLQKLIKLHNLEKNIFLMGNKKNIHKYFSMSKAFVLTSLWEDPGFVLIEAALNNVPIISSDCKSGPKEIIVDNNGGFLFQNNNVEDLKKKLVEFINTDKNEIRKKITVSKKNIRKYSLFRHFKLMENYININ